MSSFLSYLKAERQASVHTLRSYADDLLVFCRFLEETVETVPIRRRSIRRDCDVTRHGSMVRDTPATTTARRLASLRSFYQYQRRQGVVTADPAGGLRNPKQPRRLPKLLKVEDVIHLLDAIPTAGATRCPGPGHA